MKGSSKKRIREESDLIEEEASEAENADIEEDEEEAQKQADFVRNLDKSEEDDRDSDSDTDGETQKTILRKKMDFLVLSSDSDDYNMVINRTKSKKRKTKA